MHWYALGSISRGRALRGEGGRPLPSLTSSKLSQPGFTWAGAAARAAGRRWKTQRWTPAGGNNTNNLRAQDYGVRALQLMREKAATIAAINSSGAANAAKQADIQQAEAIYEQSLKALKKAERKAKNSAKQPTARAQQKEALNLRGREYQPCYIVAGGMKAAIHMLREELGADNFLTPPSGGWVAAMHAMGGVASHACACLYAQV